MYVTTSTRRVIYARVDVHALVLYQEVSEVTLTSSSPKSSRMRAPRSQARQSWPTRQRL
jgi:hypothetical protein